MQLFIEVGSMDHRGGTTARSCSNLPKDVGIRLPQARPRAPLQGALSSRALRHSNEVEPPCDLGPISLSWPIDAPSDDSTCGPVFSRLRRTPSDTRREVR